MVDNLELLRYYVCGDCRNCGKNGRIARAGAHDESETVPEMSGSKRLRYGSKGAKTRACGYFLPGDHCWSVRQCNPNSAASKGEVCACGREPSHADHVLQKPFPLPGVVPGDSRNAQSFLVLKNLRNAIRRQNPRGQRTKYSVRRRWIEHSGGIAHKEILETRRGLHDTPCDIGSARSSHFAQSVKSI